MATYLGYPFDPELFLYNWQNLKDTTTEAMLNSGAVVEDATISNLISNGSDVYTLPFYGLLTGEPTNYDGATDITTTSPEGTSMSGIVWGRSKGFSARDFIADFNSGADPMMQITSKVAKYWQMQDQKTLLNILNAIFGITGNDDWTNHTTNLASTGGTVAEGNVMAATTVGDAIQKAVGDYADQFTMAIMHSKVATNLANLQLLEFWKYTDSSGIERKLRIGDINGITVIVDDGVPVSDSASATGSKEYTTYLFGGGAIRKASAPVDHPVTTSRDEAKNGGEESLWTRRRLTMHPYGFSFTKPTTGYTSSPTEEQLGATENWSIVENAKNIPIARIITNG